MKLSKKNLLYILVLPAIMFLLFYGSVAIPQGYVKTLVDTLGIYGLVIIGLFIVIAQVFVPLSSNPALVVGFNVYGYINTLVIFYVASLFSAAIDFWIARKFGRPIVRRLVGERTLNQIDKVSQADEKTLLFISRLLGFYWFDIISYAIGFTNIKFRKYFLYTALFSTIPLIFQYYILKNFDFHSLTVLSVYFGSLTITGVIFIRIFYKYFILKTAK